jgi:hypothetical protein
MADLDRLESAVDTLEGEFVDLENRVLVLERRLVAAEKLAASAIENCGYLRGRISEIDARHAAMANQITNWMAERSIDERNRSRVEAAVCANCGADIAKMRPVSAALSMLPAGSLRDDSRVGGGEGEDP